MNNKEYKEKNKEKLRVQAKEYYLRNKDRIAQYTFENKDRTNTNRIKNIDRIKENSNNRRKTRRDEDPVYNLINNIRTSISSSFRNDDVKNSKILGCSFVYFREYIENQFETWMNWDNYGKYNGEFDYGWDLDHIIPISNAKTEEKVMELNYYTNFQPLCSKINRYKKN